MENNCKIRVYPMLKMFLTQLLCLLSFIFIFVYFFNTHERSLIKTFFINLLRNTTIHLTIIWKVSVKDLPISTQNLMLIRWSSMKPIKMSPNAQKYFYKNTRFSKQLFTCEVIFKAVLPNLRHVIRSWNFLIRTRLNNIETERNYWNLK